MSSEKEDIFQSSNEDEIRVAFEALRESNTLIKTVDNFGKLCALLKLNNLSSISLFNGLKKGLQFHNRAKKFFSGLFDRATSLTYATVNKNGELVLNSAINCCKRKVLVVGGGPCGLRMAIEAQLLGCTVVLIERRRRFSRNNIIKVADYAFKDLKSLGISTFYSAFCTGGIHAIGIRQLQLTLLKIALILGVEFHYNVALERVLEPTIPDEGWRAQLEPNDRRIELYEFDVLVDSSGFSKKPIFDFDNPMTDGQELKAVKEKQTFRKVRYFALAANFVNFETAEEKSCEEISGISRQCGKKTFSKYLDQNGQSYDIENLVYYRRETHYFLMTIPIDHLLQRNILKENPSSNGKPITHSSNVNQDELENVIVDIASIATDRKINGFEFALTESEDKDVAVFDYEPLISSNGSCRVIDRNGKRLFMALVGDSLIAPYWPDGLGIEKGFLAVMDVCYVMQQWSQKAISPLKMVKLKESLYRRLIQINSNDQAKSSGKFMSITPEKRYKSYQYRERNFDIADFYVTDGIPVSVDDDDHIIETNGSFKSKITKELAKIITVDDIASTKAPISKKSANSSSNVSVANGTCQETKMGENVSESNESFILSESSKPNGNSEEVASEWHDTFAVGEIQNDGTSTPSNDTNKKVVQKSFKKWFQASKHMRRCDSLPAIVLNSKTGYICPCCEKPILKFDHFLREKQHAVHVKCFVCAKCDFCLSGMKYTFDETDQKYYCFEHDPSVDSTVTDTVAEEVPKQFEQSLPKCNTAMLELVPSDGNKKPADNRKGFHVSAVIKKLGSLFQPEVKPMEKPFLKCLYQNKQMDICHFCYQRVYAAERMTICKKAFHRYCFKCQICGIRLSLKTFVFDKKTGCFLCIPDSRKEGVKPKILGSNKKKISQMAKKFSDIFRLKIEDEIIEVDSSCD